MSNSFEYKVGATDARLEILSGLRKQLESAEAWKSSEEVAILQRIIAAVEERRI